MFSLDDLEQIYGDSFMKHYTTLKPFPPLEGEDQQTAAPNTSLLQPHKNTIKHGNELYRQTIMLHWHHNRGRRKGKVARSAGAKKKCSCRKRRKVIKSANFMKDF